MEHCFHILAQTSLAVSNCGGMQLDNYTFPQTLCLRIHLSKHANCSVHCKLFGIIICFTSQLELFHILLNPIIDKQKAAVIETD